MQYWVAPGMIATSEMASSEENMIWSLRLFTDYSSGFKSHALGAFPWLLYQLMAKTLNRLDPPFPLCMSFCTKKDLDGAIGISPGNKSYTCYDWTDGLIGPMPDFGKGK